MRRKRTRKRIFFSVNDNGKRSSRKFIYYFRGVIAQHYIDWDATEAENPLAEETEDSYTEEGNETKGEDAA